MKLNKLRIGNDDATRGYKNFLDTTINFDESSNYSVFIGINGSGKSNLLEAISKIFRSLYLINDYEERVDFDFELIYDIKIEDISHKIKIKYISNNFSFNSNIDGRINQGEYKKYLPTQIIANYSGEESRLWDEVYLKFYKNYTDNIRHLHDIENMKMLYLNKFNWDMALISLLCLEDNKILDTLKLSIEDINSINVKFKFNYQKYETYSQNKIIELLDEINDEKKPEYTIPLLTIKLSETIQSSADNDIQRYLNLFNYLYVAHMPKTNKIITDISVEFGNYNTKKLSEGEKKMILTNFIQYLSKDKESLILLDEPDSHIHVSRKKDLANIIKNNNQYTLVTTHSPVLVNHFDEKSISLLIPNDEQGIKSVQAEKFNQIELLTDDSINLLDTSLIISTTKHILMCEGVNDIHYIKKAIEVLSRTKDIKYLKLNNIVMINCGGADNVQAVFEEIVKDNLNPNQKCNIIFDDDGTGRTCKGNIQKIIDENTLSNVQTFTHPKIPNWNTNDFYMEDYFSVNAYKNDIIDKFNAGHNLQTLNQNIDVKKLIKDNYTNNEKFQDQHFDNFTVILDKLFELFALEEN